ncbi:AI-2E family transporter [Halogranum rubrum]|nr:AI-2E family transporter [Halogranum rubrum]
MNQPSRERLGWWLYMLVLASVAVYLTYSFVGIFVLGVFGYYATRPLCDRLGRVVDSERLAATLTVLVVLLPVLVLVLYTGTQVVHQVQQQLGGNAASMLAARLFGIDGFPASGQTRLLSLLDNPFSGSTLQGSLWSLLQNGLSVVQAAFGAVILLGLSVTLSYVLLERDDALAETFVTLVGGRETTAYAYARAVDDDLESVFFGNLVFVVVMAVIATVLYAATNVVAPQGLQVPMILALGFLTGLASLIPIVVGKVVYLPVVAYLALQATRTSGNHLPFVGGAFLVYALVLDILPQSFIQPYLSGRQFDTILLLFAYVLGPILLGWYGFFLLPIVVVLLFEAVRIVLPQLVHGETLDAEPMLAAEVGSNPTNLRDEYTQSDGASDDTESSS